MDSDRQFPLTLQPEGCSAEVALQAWLGEGRAETLADQPRRVQVLGAAWKLAQQHFTTLAVKAFSAARHGGPVVSSEPVSQGALVHVWVVGCQVEHKCLVFVGGLQIFAVPL